MILIIGLGISLEVYSKDALNERAEIYYQAIEQAPFVAKLICPNFIRFNLIKQNMFSPMALYHELGKFSENLATYANTLDMVSEFSDLSKSEHELNSYTFRMFLSGQAWQTTVSESFVQSLMSLVSADVVQLIDLRSFFIKSLFNSTEFAAEIEQCQSHFGVSIEGLAEKIRNQYAKLDRTGFVAGQVALMLVGGGIAGQISKLPKIPKLFALAVSFGGTAYVGIEMITPIVRSLTRFSTSNLHNEVLDTSNLLDKKNWGELYNECLELRDRHLLYDQEKSESNKNSLYDQVYRLHPKKSILDRILNSYKTSQSLTEEQQAELALLLYVMDFLSNEDL